MQRSHARAATGQTHRPDPADAVRLGDRVLVDACRGGDESAWRELVDRYGRLVFSIPRRYGLDEGACEDVFQEVFSILVRQLPRLRNGNGLPKWFITTTHRVARQAMRQVKRERGAAAPVIDESAPPPERALEWERQHLVWSALRRLGQRCQELLMAQFRPARPPSYAQVSDQLNMPLGSIGPTRARCMRRLIEIFEELESERGGDPRGQGPRGGGGSGG